MNKNKRNNEYIQTILVEVVKEKNPNTIKELKQNLPPNIVLSDCELTDLINDLEEKGLIHLKQRNLKTSFKTFLFSTNSFWYWMIICFLLATLFVVFIDLTFFPLVYVRYIFGLIFLVFLPGFAFMKTLFPYNNSIKTNSKTIDNIELFVLSVGASLAIVSLTGLIISYSPWSISLQLIIFSLSLVTFCLATIGLFRKYFTINT